ncbi:MAG: PDZ domain-containing protein, partial [Muribaculaceae bacterium]|nr:PDZ domain-containing protein [Muribaculaceae bacterium]
MKKPSSDKFIQIGVPLIVVLALLVGILLGSHLHIRPRAKESALGKVEELFSLIGSDYVDEVNLDSLLEETIPDLLGNLDPHTAYIPARDLEAVNSDLDGSFSGIGISFQVMNDTITVLEVISGGPSEKVGLLPGDRIVEINDTVVAGKKIDADEVKRKLRGPRDSKVELKIRRPGSDETNLYTITRGDIPVTSIDASYLITPEIGYIKVNKFGRNTFTEFFTHMVMRRANGARNFI